MLKQMLVTVLRVYSQVQSDSLMAAAAAPIIGFVSNQSSDLQPLKVNWVMRTGCGSIDDIDDNALR